VEAELKVKYPDSKIALIKGSGGIFTVQCDGKMIYSKHDVAGQRFPNEGEITKLIENEIG
jgi:selT/selW/selH-like putative selenoprotein